VLRGARQGGFLRNDSECTSASVNFSGDLLAAYQSMRHARSIREASISSLQTSSSSSSFSSCILTFIINSRYLDLTVATSTIQVVHLLQFNKMQFTNVLIALVASAMASPLADAAAQAPSPAAAAPAPAVADPKPAGAAPAPAAADPKPAAAKIPTFCSGPDPNVKARLLETSVSIG